MQQVEARVERWKRDTELFAAECLKIQPKTGPPIPFLFNDAQRELMRAMDEQLERIGMVRKVLLKGRQIGGSTSIAGRFYRDASLKPGTRVQVIAHKLSATRNLAGMTACFHDHMEPALQVPLESRNQTEFRFAGISSQYSLATAGDAGDPGAAMRSETGNRLHASEFAFWKGAGDRIAGLGQALAPLPGTEGVVESTAQGQANALYDLWRMAEAGTVLWEPLFIPWYVERSYTWEPPPGFRLETESELEGVPSERDYREMFDLTMGQMYWRRLKINELSAGKGSGLHRWCQEYPATAEEAFITSADSVFHNSHHVAAARARYIDMVHVGLSPLIVGCDPATSHGTDLTCIIRRRRTKCYGLEAHGQLQSDEIVSRLYKIWRDERPQWIVVDRSGVGDHVYDTLASMGLPVIGVFFGGAAQDRQRYADKRAELSARGMMWLRDGDLPDDMELAQDILAQRKLPVERQQLRLMNKHQLEGYGARSPDRHDAWLLTMEVIDQEAGADMPGDVRAKVWKDLPQHVVA